MDPMQLDFHPLAARRMRPAGWVALGAAALVAAATGLHLAALDDALAALDARHEMLMARRQPADARPLPLTAGTALRVAAANQVIDELAVPWDALFDAIESADARGLGVLALVPNARERSVRLSGEARSVPDVLAYVDRLAALRVLGDVRLEGYETVPRDGIDVVSFSVAATWQLR
jgi:hypothetical protein